MTSSIPTSTNDSTDDPPWSPVLRGAAMQMPALTAPKHGNDEAPLSFVQEGLWFLTQFDSANQAYIIYRATRLVGPLDTQRLDRSLHALLVRHPALRTGFHATADGPVQRVIPAATACTSFRLLRAPLASEEQDREALTRHIEELVGQPFNLERAPLFRAACLRQNAETHVMVLAVHHLVSDGLSMGILHRDLEAIYAAGGDATALHPLPTRPVDHARHQRQHANTGTWHTHQEYWRKRLQGLQDLDLPTDFPYPRDMTYAGNVLRVTLPPQHAATVRALARQHGTTRFRAYLAVFQVLLMRLSGSQNFAIGIPVAGRHDPDLDLDGVVGYFVNTMAIRMQLGGNSASTFIDLLIHAHQSVSDAQVHSEYPFGRIVADLAPRRDPGRNPLYQAYFTLQNLPDRAVKLEGLQSTPIHLDKHAARFDISLEIVDDERGYAALWEYRTDLFKAATIERISQDYLTLLEAVLSTPEQSIDGLALCVAPQRPPGLATRDPAHPLLDSETGHEILRPLAQTSPQDAIRCDLDTRLQVIWQDVLRQPHIGLHDDFFALGGHSLHATRIVSQIRALFGIELALRTMFEYPTLAAQAREMKTLIARHETLDARASIPLATRGKSLPVSFSQRRMWLLHQVDPDSAAYNVWESLRLRGTLDEAALQAALDALVARHEAFRTRFALDGREPVAVLDAPATATIEAIEALNLAPEQSTRVTWERVERRAAAAFDLERGPLHRFILAKLGENDHLFVLVMHHIVSDDWSGGILVGELATLYGAHRRKLPPRLPPKPIDFIDYAAWQRQHSDNRVLQAQTSYWLARLAGMSPLNLPTDSGKSVRSSSRGDRVRLPLSDALIDELQRVSTKLGATPFMVLLGAFLALLARWCAQSDVVVGFPIANRTRVEAESVVGSLVNTLVMRAEVDMSQTFLSFVQGKLHASVLGAFAHQDIPYDHLIERLRASGQAGPAPGIRVLFNVLNSPRQPFAFDSLEAEHVSLNLGATQFDMALHMAMSTEKALMLSYSTELFDAATIEGLAALYLRGLTLALRAPDIRLDAMWAAPPGDLDQLARWNKTPGSGPAPTSPNVTTLLSTLRSHPGTALRDANGHTLAYAELWAAVDHLTHILRGRGIQRGTRVGLGMERGLDMVVCQLAVLQSGAAYVPLDPSYPTARLRDMLDDAGLTLLVTDASLTKTWANAPAPLLLLDAVRATLGAASAQPLAPDPLRDPLPEDPAYVIYTSGSTGKPKGVVVPHRAVVNFLTSMRHVPGLRPHDVVLAVTTLSFDIAVLELLLPLSVGACAVIASHEEAADGTSLRTRLQISGATVMQATPATWRMLLDSGWSGAPGFKALVGGEALNPALAQALLTRCGEVWNMYGPTETTVWSTCWRVEDPPASICIGRAIANTQVHVLDAGGHPCPIGFSGEIHIGGEGVATGYLHHPKLTAERFVHDAFAALPGARLYKTGDRGRWRHDGQLEHQGRLDFQVKLRGYRIELGEIETHLQDLPGVAQCLAMVREDVAGEQRLTVYVVSHAQPLSTQALRDALRARLPTYMVPQHFVHLDDLPRLPNGKIDRRALPPPHDPIPPLASPDDDTPTTPAERALARIWAELLGQGGIRRGDNFFDLGGHSLLANRAVIAFEQTMGQRLALRRLIFETLGQLAAGVSLPQTATGDQRDDAVRPAAATGLWSRLRRRLGLGRPRPKD